MPLISLSDNQLDQVCATRGLCVPRIATNSCTGSPTCCAASRSATARWAVLPAKHRILARPICTAPGEPKPLAKLAARRPRVSSRT